MSISEVTTASSVFTTLSTQATTGSSATESNDLGQNDFLNILMAQLQNQDPLNPIDSTDYTSQLAQFSSLEQQIATNTTLSEISDKLDTETETSPLDYIGKEVVTDTGVFTLSDGQTQDLSFSIDAAATVEMIIYDSDGVEVLRSSSDFAAGAYDVTWDGTDAAENPVSDGTYSYEITGKDASGEPVAVAIADGGTVTGVAYEDGIPYLLMGDLRVDPESIVEIRLPETDTDQ